MNSREAYEVYEFTDNKPLYYLKVCAKLEAFKIVGYLLEDNDFKRVWDEIYGIINKWFEEVNANINVGARIFKVIQSVGMRISKDDIVDIAIKCFEKKCLRFYDDMFKMLCHTIILDEVDQEKANKLVGYVVDIISDDNQKNHYNSLPDLLIVLRRQNNEITDELDKVIENKMFEFYNGTYKLEFAKDLVVALEFVTINLKDIREKNNEQGKNGTVYGYAQNPYLTISNIITNMNLDCNDLIKGDIVKACIDTLNSKTQTVNAKIDAINLIIFLKEKFDISKKDTSSILETLISNKSVLECASAFMDNMNQAHLEFHMCLLLAIMGENYVSEIIEKITDMQDNTLAHITEAKAFANYIRVAGERADIMLINVVLQNAIFWSKSDDLDVRYNATKLILELLKFPDLKNIVIKQIFRMINEEVANIKALILRKSDKIKNIDNATYEQIVEIGKKDRNYAVRKIALEL